MTTEQIIEVHQTCTQILEGIQHFENMVKLTQDHIDLVKGMFPELGKRYDREMDIYKMCIERLKQRYVNQTRKL